MNYDESMDLLDVLALIKSIYDSNAPSVVPESTGSIDFMAEDRNLLHVLFLIDHIYGVPPGPPPQCSE